MSEIYGNVDQFFITESHISHFQSLKKRLMWHLLAKQKLFERYLDKFLYFNITIQMIDEYIEKVLVYRNNIWKNKDTQEYLRFSLFLKWN